MRFPAAFLPLLALAATTAHAARPCITADALTQHAEKEICLSAHVYTVTQTSDGTRYLDVCKPSDGEAANCHLTILSLSEDKKEVGDLSTIQGQDIQLRGVVHISHGDATMLVSHARQFHDGPEKFRPNPALLAGFGADTGKTAFKDPAMSSKHKNSSAFAGAMNKPIQ